MAGAPINTVALGRSRGSTPLPGFGLSMGITIFWLSAIVLVPLAAVFARSTGGGWDTFAAAAFSARAIASYKLTFGAAFLAAAINAVFGLLVALPTAVAGIALTALYADTGLIGAQLAKLGIAIAYKPAGVVLALTFIGLPFVVRTIEPVLAEASSETEEAALTLGASRLQTFRRVIFPMILPALATGFALAFARGAGEYGSVIFIAGNMPFESEIAPLLIVTQLEEFNFAGAAAIATVMLVVSFIMLLLLNLLQQWQKRRLS
jgi:sulfate transport system permease protein